MNGIDNNHYLIDAWRHYLEHPNIQKLLECARQGNVDPSDLQILLWLAVGVYDWKLVEEIERRGVSLKMDPERGHGLIFDALFDFGDKPDAIEWLIRRGARLDLRGPNDWTPLHMACCQGYLDCARVLVRQGAAIDAMTSIDGGLTPLMEACSVGNWSIVEFLLSSGADAKVRSPSGGGTARDMALRGGHKEVVAEIDHFLRKQRPRS